MTRTGIFRGFGLTLATTALAMLAGGAALAATDGVLGLTSTGTTVVSITKGDQVQITGMTDIVLPAWTAGDPAPAGSTGACVFTTTGLYQVTVTSLNTSGADFRVFDGGLNYVVYTTTWNDGFGADPLTGGTALVTQAGDAVSLICGGTTPATLAMGITVPNMNAATPGAYTDTLTVVVAPE